jgi:hypothetical protein
MTTKFKVLGYWEMPHHIFRERRQLVHRGRIVERFQPIFPSYIFVDPTGRFRTVEEIIGVIGWLRLGENIAEVDETIVDGLVAAGTNDVLPVPERPIASRFFTGDRVQIVGPSVMAGQIGIFQRMLTPLLALVDLDWMGRMVPLSVDERDLFPERAARRRHRRQRPRRRHRRPPAENGHLHA